MSFRHASHADGERELVMARWGMPGPPQFGGQPVTNIRNVKSPHWQRWLGQASRCIVPATSFCEYADTKPRKTPKWFALSDDRPLLAFAGLWTPWRGVRGPKSAPINGDHELFGFLTTEANTIVAPIHPKAMPVILTTPEEIDLWLRLWLHLAERHEHEHLHQAIEREHSHVHDEHHFHLHDGR